MIRRAVTGDSVAVTGIVIGLISFWLGWLTLKSSRISGGTSLSLYEILDWIIPSVILGLWFVCFALSFIRKGKSSVVVLGTVANKAE